MGATALCLTVLLCVCVCVHVLFVSLRLFCGCVIQRRWPEVRQQMRSVFCCVCLSWFGFWSCSVLFGVFWFLQVWGVVLFRVVLFWFVVLQCCDLMLCVVVFCAAWEGRLESPQAICCVVGRTEVWACVSSLARLKRAKLW